MNRNLIIGLIAITAAIAIYLKMVQPPEEPPIVVPPVVPPVRPPVVPPVVPPVRPPVMPPGAPVPVPFNEFRRLFPDLAAKIERIYREAGHPLPPHVYVPPEKKERARLII